MGGDRLWNYPAETPDQAIEREGKTDEPDGKRQKYRPNGGAILPSRLPYDSGTPLLRLIHRQMLADNGNGGTGGPDVMSHHGGVPHHAGFACGAFDFRPLGLTPDRFSGLLLLSLRATTVRMSASPKRQEIIYKTPDLVVRRFRWKRRHLVVLAGFETLDQLD